MDPFLSLKIPGLLGNTCNIKILQVTHLSWCAISLCCCCHGPGQRIGYLPTWLARGTGVSLFVGFLFSTQNIRGMQCNMYLMYVESVYNIFIYNIYPISSPTFFFGGGLLEFLELFLWTPTFRRSWQLSKAMAFRTPDLSSKALKNRTITRVSGSKLHSKNPWRFFR